MKFLKIEFSATKFYNKTKISGQSYNNGSSTGASILYLNSS